MDTRTDCEDDDVLDTVMYGVPPTTLPKSSTTTAERPPDDGLVRTVEPLPPTASAAALVTVPAVLVMATGRTLSLVGPGTRLCQLGLAGQVGSAAAAGAAAVTTAMAVAASVTALVSPATMVLRRRRPLGLVLSSCTDSPRVHIRKAGA
ncbi:hypothetical protein Ais01nite_13460 [Asanoa ishikariensis]|nr:hypothetical protein Ais01nite_13460 [Asanoa ishikariensis]